MGSVSNLRRHWALVLCAVLHMLPFIWNAVTWDGFWTSVAPFSTLLALAVLVALLRGHRWAWILLVALNVLALVSFIWDRTDAVVVVLDAARLALLLSPPVRSYVGHAAPRERRSATGASEASPR